MDNEHVLARTKARAPPQSQRQPAVDAAENARPMLYAHRTVITATPKTQAHFLRSAHAGF